MGTVKVDRHWYLTEDEARVVGENDSEGRWLWAAPGDEVDREEAERLGAVKKPEPEAKMQKPPEDKATKPAEDKATKPAENKSAKG